jgi:hypothetical protein
MRVLWSGIDTLEAFFRGNLREGLAEKLQQAKEQAQAEEMSVPFQIGDQLLFVAPTGVKPWAWLLTSEDLHLRLSASRKVPTASTRLTARGLVTQGHEALYDLAASLAGQFGARTEGGLSRLDLAVDFQGFEPTLAEMEAVVCSASFRPVYPNLKKPETFQFGKGDIVVRIYNKTKELAKSGKTWLEAVWYEHPDYDPTEAVWRFEVQYRRKMLKQLCCTQVADAFAHLSGLLGYALYWCELRVPEGENRTRWAVDPRWDELRAATFAGKPLPRVKEEARAVSFAQVAPQVVGLLVSGAAGAGIWELEEAFTVCEREANRYLVRKGKTFTDLVAERRRRNGQ